MKKIKEAILGVFLSERLPLGARMLNFVCLLAVLSIGSMVVARLAAGLPIEAIRPVFWLAIAAAAMLIFSISRARDTTHVTAIATGCMGVVFVPMLFFTNGGVSSGNAACFALVMILAFLLLRGAQRIVVVSLTCAAMVFCYAAVLFWGWATIPRGGASNLWLFVDNVQAILIAGLSVGALVVFQDKVYLREKEKAETSGEGLRRSEELLTLVNEAAELLLTMEPARFEEALTLSMEKMGTCLGVDRVAIWRAREDGYTPSYVWNAQAVTERVVVQMARVPEVDERLMGKRERILARTAELTGSMRTRMERMEVLAIMAFPVFLQDVYWGFVSFSNTHSERLCGEREATILQSGSLLLANAVERNESTIRLNRRLAQQQLMSQIARGFVGKGAIGERIAEALGQAGRFLQVERVLIGVFEKDSEISRPGYVWVADPQYAPLASMSGFSRIFRDIFPHVREEGDANPTIFCENTLTCDGGKYRLLYEKGGQKAFIGGPIYVDGELWGLVSVEAHENFRTWSESDAQLVSMLSSAIAGAVARDIMDKERAAALEQAIHNSRAKGDFLSNMSHEMRTPLNAIIGMNVIGRTASTLEKKNEAFGKIDEASKHLLNVINDVLDMSKIEADKLELSPIDFDFERMLRRAVDVINFRADERRQKLYVKIDPAMPRTLVGDDQRFAQVVTNLLSNAVKFTPEEGTIRLEAALLSEEDGCCRLQVTVADTGIGLTPEQQTRLFRSFEQAEAGTTRRFGGTGLGLAISRRIVELMGGEIWVESEPGKGATFIFTATLGRGEGKPRRLLAEGVDWSNIHLFAVDDEPEIRQFFRDAAQSLGIVCDVAASAEEAAAMLAKQSTYDMYFLDWRLPGMSGVELAQDIREKIGQQPVVILFSSADWSDIEKDARTAGVSRFLPKPLFQSSIVDLINECMGVAPGEEAVPEAYEDDFAGHTILLAEDVEINREIVLALLEDTGVTIECAENGAVALAMFAADPRRYEMIFMDVQMPEMDGYEATRHIRALEDVWARAVPIVAMTANVFREDVERCLAAGMNAHVGKPLDINEVLATLRRILRSR